MEDFGYQGEAPSHPELLDWMAVEFVKPTNDQRRMTNDQSQKDNIALDASNNPRSSFVVGRSSGGAWSLKRMHRLIVTSATYRQASRVTPALKAKDPQNRLLARGPRARLDAELLRDAALTASGLLSHKLGGPSVFPPQPANVTTEGAYGALAWNVSQGEDRYRRGLYTFSKRTAPYAMFTTFDAPSGEACCPRREMSNTPLQALTLMNDQVFVEAAQALGKKAAERPGQRGERAVWLFRVCATRPPQKEELALLTKFTATQQARFESKETGRERRLPGRAEGDSTSALPGRHSPVPCSISMSSSSSGKQVSRKDAKAQRTV
jgi:hypothetical protein